MAGSAVHKNFFNKTNVILSSILLLTAGLLATSFVVDHQQTKRIKTVEYRNVNFDSRSSDPGKTSVKTFKENIQSDVKEVDISFLMKVYSISHWNNVFQTARLNEGIRMELSQPSNVGIVIATNDSEGLKGFSLFNAIEFNKIYAVKVSVGRNNILKACVDDSCINVRDNQFKYDIKDIAVGAGLSKTRPFDGEINDFRIAYTLIKAPHHPFLPWTVILFVQFLLFASVASLVFSFLRTVSIPLERKDKISIVCLAVLAGFILSVLFHCFMGAYLHMGYPFNTFLLQPDDRFMDYFNGLTYVTAGHGAGMAGTSGLAYFMWQFLYLISFKNAYASFLVYTAAVTMYVLVYNLKNLLSGPFPKMSPLRAMQSVFILSFLAYPVLFTLDRGNIEGFVFILLSLFMYFFRSNKTGISAIFLAGATALKLYPAIFIILYLSEKRYREAAIFVGITLLLSSWNYNSFTGISFHFSSLVGITKSSGNSGTTYNALYVIGDAGAAFCSSAFGALKTALCAWPPQGSAPRLLMLFRIYYWVSLLLSAFVGVYVMFVEKELWKKVTILTLSMIFFPFVTADYRLLHLYIPMWLFLNAKGKSRSDLLYSVLFALLLIPKAYYVIKEDISISVILNPLIISAFLLSVVVAGLRNASITDIKQSIREHLTAARQLFWLKKIHSAAEALSNESP